LQPQPVVAVGIPVSINVGKIEPRAAEAIGLERRPEIQVRGSLDDDSLASRPVIVKSKSAGAVAKELGLRQDGGSNQDGKRF